MKRNSALRDSVLRRTAGEIRGYNRTMKVLAALLGMLTVVTSLLFVVAALYTESGSFTVTIDKVEMTKYALTLSESPDMSKMTSNLNAEIHESITNIAEESIPANVDMVDGVHNGQNYIAYTFYLQNRGEYEFPVEYSVNMTNITSGLDEAIRLKLYVNGEPTVYAKTRSDGTGPEEGTTEFLSESVIARDQQMNFAPGDVTKYTVVIWLEGNDPECLDNILGGEFKIDMSMSIVGLEDDEK